MLAAAVALPAYIVSAAFLGWQADLYFLTAPLGLTLGVIVGTGVGVWRLVVAVQGKHRG